MVFLRNLVEENRGTASVHGGLAVTLVAMVALLSMTPLGGKMARIGETALASLWPF